MALTFESVANPAMHQIMGNPHGYCALTTLRDTLLPKLIYCKLNISDAEHSVAQALST